MTRPIPVLVWHARSVGGIPQAVLKMLLGLVKNWSLDVAAEKGLSRDEVSAATLKTFGSYHLG